MTLIDLHLLILIENFCLNMKGLFSFPRMIIGCNVVGKVKCNENPAFILNCKIHPPFISYSSHHHFICSISSPHNSFKLQRWLENFFHFGLLAFCLSFLSGLLSTFQTLKEQKVWKWCVSWSKTENFQTLEKF